MAGLLIGTDGGINSTHNSVAKAWVNFFQSSSDDAISSSYGVSSTAHADTGLTTVNFSSDFANTNYAVVIGGYHDTGGTVRHLSLSVGSLQVECRDSSGGLTNNNPVSIAIFS